MKLLGTSIMRHSPNGSRTMKSSHLQDRASAGAALAPQFIEVTLTAAPGFKVHLNSFDISNEIGPRLLPHLQVTRCNGAVLLAASAVPINGGPGGTHTPFNNSGAGWTGQSLVIRLDAPFDGALYL